VVWRHQSGLMVHGTRDNLLVNFHHPHLKLSQYSHSLPGTLLREMSALMSYYLDLSYTHISLLAATMAPETGPVRNLPFELLYLIFTLSVTPDEVE